MTERTLSLKNTKHIFEMINQVASGNFNYEIPLDEERDLLNTLRHQLNLMAQELRENFKHFAYVNPHLSYKFITHSTIILDQEGIIAACTPSSKTISDGHHEIIGTKFLKYLTKKSKKDFQGHFNTIKRKKKEKLSFRIQFKHQLQSSGLMDCYVKPLQTIRKECYLSISFFQNGIYSNSAKIDNERPSLSRWDTISLQEAYDYLLYHVGEPKLSDTELAEKFKLSTNRLKHGFKQLFGMSPFMFYNKIRLEEAKARIENTHQPLKLIASDLNFKSYTQFSAAFKKYFGQNPSDYLQ
ncbi:helix-turn-helix domain-containing protein [Zunongwangia endophytica]|uniref:Helix-turn-helix domain-containing protein n=1 Tax=Zunongwangia endophytica TaxID=1808945 RepID=A0ABV8HE29_9FLAO|nr:helix-turn-helix domain-containing protein [Zunongwangia endophytica]MDN3594388.1 helix-turn-helix domain-containing protein [Zunongwangia endophytica]